MMRKFTLGLIGAVMIALPATLASAQGNGCAPGGKAAACATSAAPQAQQQNGQKQQQKKAAPAQQQAKSSGTPAAPKAQQTATTQNSAKAQPSPAAMKKGQKFAGSGEKLPDPKAYGLKEERGASYYKKDGQVYRVDNETREILAVVGAVADLLN